MHRAKTARIRQYFVTHLLVATHARPQNKRPASAFQFLDRFLTHHAAIRHDTGLANAKAAPQAIDYGNQGGDVGGIAGPEFAADRPAVLVEHGTDHHLMQVGTMILAVTMLAQ